MQAIVDEALYLADKFESLGHTHRAIQCYRICCKFLTRMENADEHKLEECRRHIERLQDVQKKRKTQLCKISLIRDSQ
ncbi:hypothetical protein SlsnVgp118 [Spodoptera littoralis nucleopolyhedrovirus]|uniref:Uncharacterized protein n=2 Tax=Alphabaculovirus TaxID=558016 RepID=B0LUN0_NPVST|nr:hypothetical protein SlsnVgp118 [Spodoptera littoralis nucleopolyhedrovirus]ABY84888.1 unknown protein [Spodoptera litura nucleopolyhedrovirus]AAM93423.1 ORF 6 [Spodoptera littoralis nucleopolyhedrovirus]ABY84894.1 unknown protein [Spodoptera litura nucleopolyhedrovirus]AGE89973.1 hypothetical protein SlsnVgp118 [Spodoptera littoralis nucleopolyhedrovirus]AYU75305.1 hypothetical protein [Spodoptera littoralis nucleopolyhedrovirus]